MFQKSHQSPLLSFTFFEPLKKVFFKIDFHNSFKDFYGFICTIVAEDANIKELFFQAYCELKKIRAQFKVKRERNILFFIKKLKISSLECKTYTEKRKTQDLVLCFHSFLLELCKYHMGKQEKNQIKKMGIKQKQTVEVLRKQNSEY